MKNRRNSAASIVLGVVLCATVAACGSAGASMSRMGEWTTFVQSIDSSQPTCKDGSLEVTGKTADYSGQEIIVTKESGSTAIGPNQTRSGLLAAHSNFGVTAPKIIYNDSQPANYSVTVRTAIGSDTQIASITAKLDCLGGDPN